MFGVRYASAIAPSQGLLFIEAPSCSHPMAQRETEQDGQSGWSIYRCVNYIVLKGQSFTQRSDKHSNQGKDPVRFIQCEQLPNQI